MRIRSRHAILHRMDDDQYTPEEAAERMERGLRRALNMPHKPQAEPKRNKRRPASKGRVRKGKSQR
jgi:hypothetical protein